MITKYGKIKIWHNAFTNHTSNDTICFVLFVYLFAICCLRINRILLTFHTKKMDDYINESVMNWLLLILMFLRTRDFHIKQNIDKWIRFSFHLNFLINRFRNNTARVQWKVHWDLQYVLKSRPFINIFIRLMVDSFPLCSS